MEKKLVDWFTLTNISMKNTQYLVSIILNVTCVSVRTRLAPYIYNILYNLNLNA